VLRFLHFPLYFPPFKAPSPPLQTPKQSLRILHPALLIHTLFPIPNYLRLKTCDGRPMRIPFLSMFAWVSGWTTLEAIDSLIRKAGYNSRITDSLRKSIKLTRYQSTLFTMHYGEYVSYVKETRGEAPSIVGVKLPG